MPYFERKPYAEFEKIANQAPPPSANSDSNVMEDSLLVRQAADILRKQSNALPSWRAAGWNSANTLLSIPSDSATLGTAVAPVILTAAPATVGQQVRIPISLINDSNDDVPLAVHFTDLVSSAGDRIPTMAVSWMRPASSVTPRGVVNTDIGIQIPEIPPGEYCGLMACRDAQPAILTVIVSG